MKRTKISLIALAIVLATASAFTTKSLEGYYIDNEKVNFTPSAENCQGAQPVCFEFRNEAGVVQSTEPNGPYTE